MRTLLAVLVFQSGLLAQLPPMVAPIENPTTKEKVVLGKMLFWEEQLSSDDAMACGTCHRPDFGGADARTVIGVHPGPDLTFGTDDDVRGSESVVRQASSGDFTPVDGFGMRPQATRRTSPTVLGVGHHARLNWDGSVDDTFVDPQTGTVRIASGGALEAQALLPILNPVEMAQEGRTWDDVIDKLANVQPLRLASNLPKDVQVALAQHGDYPALFEAAFDTPVIDATRIAYALASYQRTLNPDRTPWDEFIGGRAEALTERERTGWRLFSGKGRCTTCHPAPFFSDDDFHHLGLRPSSDDIGNGAGTFKTPTLRNAGLRPRLFHNGQSPALGDAAQTSDPRSALLVHYHGGGEHLESGDPALLRLEQLNVTLDEAELMFEFVRTALTDPRAKNRLPPFDHPDLRSMVEPPPRLFGESLAGESEPFLIDWVPPYPGNYDFKLGLVGGQPGSVAILVVGFESREPTLYVDDLPINVVRFLYVWFEMQGEAGSPGRATWHVPLPNDPGLATIPLYYQMFVSDPFAPGGIAASQGTEFFIR